jgi:hypothetical protein
MLVPALLAQQHCFETTSRSIDAERTAVKLLMCVTSRVIPAARLVRVDRAQAVRVGDGGD